MGRGALWAGEREDKREREKGKRERERMTTVSHTVKQFLKEEKQ